MPAVEAATVEADPGPGADELESGSGTLRIRRVLRPAAVTDAKDVVAAIAGAEGGRERAWGLLELGEPFTAMVEHPALLALVDTVLGDRARLGSVSAVRVPPASPATDPRRAYPYWDLHNRAAFPRTLGQGPALALFAVFLLDDFSGGRGGIDHVPGSHRELGADETAPFDRSALPMTGIAGDVVVVNSGVRHAFAANTSERDCSFVIVEYVAKFVRPPEGVAGSPGPELLAGASPALRRLLGEHPRSTDPMDAPPHGEAPEPLRRVEPRRMSRRSMLSFGTDGGTED